MTYAPLPNTIPARAIEVLSRLDKGASMSTAELAEEIGQPSGSMHAYLAAAVKAGRLVKAIRPGTRNVYWSLGDGTLPEPEAEDGPRVRVVSATPHPLFSDGSVTIDAHTGQVKGAPAPFRAAIWSDGSMEIHRDTGERIALTAEETRALADYVCAAWPRLELPESAAPVR